MLPVIAHNLLQSITLLGNASRLLADKAIAGFTVNQERISGLGGQEPHSRDSTEPGHRL